MNGAVGVSKLSTSNLLVSPASCVSSILSQLEIKTVWHYKVKIQSRGKLAAATQGSCVFRRLWGLVAGCLVVITIMQGQDGWPQGTIHLEDAKVRRNSGAGNWQLLSATMGLLSGDCQHFVFTFSIKYVFSWSGFTSQILQHRSTAH